MLLGRDGGGGGKDLPFSRHSVYLRTGFHSDVVLSSTVTNDRAWQARGPVLRTTQFSECQVETQLVKRRWAKLRNTEILEVSHSLFDFLSPYLLNLFETKQREQGSFDL